MSDKIWVVKTPGGVFVEYEEPRMDMSVCTVEAYIKEERLIRAEARIKVLEEALAGIGKCKTCKNHMPENTECLHPAFVEFEGNVGENEKYKNCPGWEIKP